MSGVKPILKWVGGKRQLLPQLRQYYPAAFGRYIEPFLGSAAVFFDLYNSGRLDGHGALLADSSADLIGCYTAVRDRVDDVIGELEALEAGHQEQAVRHYYEVRDERFNPLRRARSGGAASAHADVALAAMLIYLNRTGYNGLFRVNADGDYNVPMGRYERPRICDAANLRAASRALKAPGVRLALAPFTESLAAAGAHDFVYLDPPYVPLTRSASFTAYTAGGFDSGAQHRLRDLVVELAGRGVQVLLSNSSAAEVTALYAEAAQARGAGLRTCLVPARRAVNSKGASRGPVLEYVITNVGC